MANKQHLLLINLPEFIIGAEEEPDPKGKGESEEDEEGDEGAPKGSEEHDDANKPEVKGLKTALEAERREKKALAKQLKAFQDAKDEAELADASEAQKATARAEKAEAAALKLSTGFVRTSLDIAIRNAAAAFIDPTDALSGVDRSKITFEQDQDDPSEVTIDTKSVEAAVKELATKKPHFLKSGTDDGEPTGGQFGGTKKKQKTEADDLKALYPSLN